MQGAPCALPITALKPEYQKAVDDVGKRGHYRQQQELAQFFRPAADTQEQLKQPGIGKKQHYITRYKAQERIFGVAAEHKAAEGLIGNQHAKAISAKQRPLVRRVENIEKQNKKQIAGQRVETAHSNEPRRMLKLGQECGRQKRA